MQQPGTGHPQNRQPAPYWLFGSPVENLITKHRDLMRAVWEKHDFEQRRHDSEVERYRRAHAA